MNDNTLDFVCELFEGVFFICKGGLFAFDATKVKKLFQTTTTILTIYLQ